MGDRLWAIRWIVATRTNVIRVGFSPSAVRDFEGEGIRKDDTSYSFYAEKYSRLTGLEVAPVEEYLRDRRSLDALGWPASLSERVQRALELCPAARSH